MPDLDSPELLLEAAYNDLDFTSGELLHAMEAPESMMSAETWVNHGGWLALAKKVGAERIFFVDGTPVVIFARLMVPKTDWRMLYNQIWCMARPPLLFLAQPGELTVLDLTKAPIRVDEDLESVRARICATVSRALDVQNILQEYNRSQIESGRLFEEQHFGATNRADRALIRDLGKVRNALLDSGLEVGHAHALIGRSIFVRYLEDRGILIEEYFRQIAGKNSKWNKLLDAAPKPASSERDYRLFYTSVLRDKGFADALFERLAKDFNGDLFPFDAAEHREFTFERLEIVRKFLVGEIEDACLFFFAYDFKIIPIELISSMYEEFLKIEKGKSNTQGSFYTPAALVEFVLSQVLTPKVIELRPRVLDPACGSAIFLVEAFRRLVRQRVHQVQRRLRSNELRSILRDQIAGIDVNPEAVRVAAFSLYLALLHYLDPPDILNNELPTLLFAERNRPVSSDHFDILLPRNAFDDLDDQARKRFGSKCADIVVGNPPWGEPKDQDEATKNAAKTVTDWCAKNKCALGDKELSQAFIHLTLDRLKQGGRAGLLVSTGVLFKRHQNSRRFREQWFERATLRQVVNFAAVRDVFFTGAGHVKGAIAPFAAVIFDAGRRPRVENKFQYYSAKETAYIDRLQVVSLKRIDLHIVRQSEFAADDDLWKVFWWGGHRDKALLQALRLENTLESVVDPTSEYPERIGEGFKESKKNRKPTKTLHSFKQLPTNSFIRYSPLPWNLLIPPPSGVERERDPVIYQGTRLLIKRGITQKDGADGQILARLETRPFCFRHSIYGIRLLGPVEREAEVLLGIIWSSLTRYFVWLTAGSWGMWHHEILKETILRIPIRLPKDFRIRRRIERTVQALRKMQSVSATLFSSESDEVVLAKTDVLKLEKQLDDAVFDLFELTEAERDLVLDMCKIGLPFFYGGVASKAAKPLQVAANQRISGTIRDLPRPADRNWLEAYIGAFLEIWESEMPPDGRFRWHLIRAEGDPTMIAVLFRTEEKGHPDLMDVESQEAAWSQLLEGLGKASRHQLGSRRIYIDGMTRIVRENEICIIKQNEFRLWTKSVAREDAEATLLEAARRQKNIRSGD